MFMSRNNQEKVYSSQEKAAIADEFSPALAEVLETVAPAWGNKVIVETESKEVVSPSPLFKLRQLGDQGLRMAMRQLKGE